jgi:uncharacterized protein (TIGR02646 family)
VLRIAAQGPPPTFATHLATESSFGQIKSLPEVRGKLYDEQNGRCAYCERRLRDASGASGTRIEHFHPQHGARQQEPDACLQAAGASTLEQAAVSWTNLLLCCGGTGWGTDTCDVRKGSEDICGVLKNPKTIPASLPSLIHVGPTGSALPYATNDAGAQQVIDTVLALNTPFLASKRAEVYSEWLRLFQRARHRGRGLGASERAKLVGEMQSAARSNEFGSTILSVAARIAAAPD